MSATSGRDAVKNGILQGTLDADSNKIINANLTDSSNTLPTSTSTSIAHTTSVLKGDGAGAAVAASIQTDYWGNDEFVASGASATRGLVPAPPNVAGATKFLREDKSWAVPAAATVPTIASTTSVLKGDNAGNASAATAKTDFWDTTTVVNGGSHTKGLAPDPGSGSGTTKFLREDGTWNIPPASAGVVIASTTLVIKGDNAGGGVAATPGTDYVVPSTALTRLTAATVAVSGATPIINWASSTSFSLTLSTNATLTFSNAADTYDVSIAITNTASNYTVTWPAGIKWQAATTPTQTVGAKTDIWTLKQFGSTIYGSVHPNHS